MNDQPTCKCGAQPDVRTVRNQWVEIVCQSCGRFIAPRSTYAIALSVWRVQQILDDGGADK
jgi:hypothetical protein